MPVKHPFYRVVIAGVTRDLRKFEVAPGVIIAILNILGDTELVQACAKALAKKIHGVVYDVIVTAESKSIPLAHALSVATKKPYIILRKAYKNYMGKTIEAETLSITTGKPQTLFLDEKDHTLLKGKRVIVLDDVISTGSTLDGMKAIVKKGKGTVVAVAAVFTEGDCEQWKDIISLGNLPLFKE
jgi:adenine/guanine phosphoribosyltransferase-like PRPP-binding protein